MAELDHQPLKKRKIYDTFISNSPQSETLTNPNPPQTPPQTPLSQDDIVKKRSNREEVKSLHDVYKRLKYCVDHKTTSQPQLLQAFGLLIEASKGCASAQRIAADLIPRYARYCVTSIEAAVEALIYMYTSSESIMAKDEDDSGVAFDVVVACVIGLADICCIAPSQLLMAKHVIHSSLLWRVLLFFLSSFGEKILNDIIDHRTLKMLKSVKYFQELKQKILDDDDKPISQKLMILRCLSLFRIVVCRPKETLSACFDSMLEQERPHDNGLFFLKQLTTRCKTNDCDNINLCSDPTQIPASGRSPIETGTGSKDKYASVANPVFGRCLLEVVIAKDHSLRKWLISKCNILRGSVLSEDVSVLTSAVEGLLGSAAVTQEDGFGSCEEDNSATSSSASKQVQASNSEVQMSNTPCANANSNYENAGVTSQNHGDLPSNVLGDQFLSPRTRKSSDLNVLNDNSALISPTSSREPYSGNQTTELFDGDSEAMDVFSASKLLWVGSLTADASEGKLRFQFERLGPIELLHVHAVNSYAIVGFKYIMDAIKARDYMRMHTPWDVRFSNGTGISPSNNVPAGSSPYVYVGNISSQWVKDETLYECRKVVHNGPCMITDLTREYALLLEFGTPDEAAKIMTHLRRYRRERVPPLNTGTSCPGAIRNNVSGNVSTGISESFHSHPHPQSHQQPITQSPVDRRVITVQSQQVNNSATSFNNNTEGGYREHISPRQQPDILRNLPQGGHPIHSQWPVSEADRRPLSGGYTEQMWIHTTPVNISGVSSQVHVPQPQFVQPGQFMQPVFAPRCSSWDPRAGIQPMNVNPPGIVHNQSHGVRPTHFVTPVSSSVVVPPQFSEFPQPLPGMPPLPLCSPLPDHPHPPPPLPLGSPKTQAQAPSASHVSNTGNAPPSTDYHWQGTLSKSGVRFCTIQSKRTDSELCKYTTVRSEPSEWPSKFDMTKRTDFQHVKSTFKSTPSHKKEVCRLYPSSPADHKGFQDFVSYLKQRNCVGVIKVPAAKAMWARLIFLIPYSIDICSFLSILPSPSDCLIALVLPKEPCLDG